MSHCPKFPSSWSNAASLRASICLQSFPAAPTTPLSPSSYISSILLCLSSSYSLLSPSLTRAMTGAVINHESQALSAATQPRGTLPSPLHHFYLSQSLSFNKFVPVNKPSQMTPRHTQSLIKHRQHVGKYDT